MVKIREDYVMTAREKAEFDRVNALSRKTSGRVDFYYKPQTKYPATYIFIHARRYMMLPQPQAYGAFPSDTVFVTPDEQGGNRISPF